MDWAAFLDDYGSTSDFPACLFWPEILEANPGAVVVLSTRRRRRDAWWESASQTIFAIAGGDLPPEMADWFEMWRAVASARFTSNWTDKDAALAAYERHNAEVRASVPAFALVDWQAADGWKPLCDALGLDVPAEPFPAPQHPRGLPHGRRRHLVDRGPRAVPLLGIVGAAGSRGVTSGSCPARAAPPRTPWRN